MTQEQKAKAYDDALKRAKITLDCCDSASTVTKNTVYGIFPELRKSEDEEIRKILIELVKATSEFYGNEWKIDDYSEERVIAWLQKQGVQKFDNIEKLLQAEYKKGWDNALLQLPKEVESQIWQIANNSAKTWEESFAILCATQKAYNKGKKDASKEYWKPSEEQIGVIEAVINNRSFQRRHLDSLYEQLKKLKGK